VTNGQMLDVTLAYIQRNPETRHYPRITLVTSALTKTFPCRKASK
jgi:hypothetical protein